MDNPQDIHWFAGFFEGEGSFSFRARNKRGKIKGLMYEPKISISNTNALAIEKCENVLQTNYISYTKSLSVRTGKIDCYSLDICSNLSVSLFVDKFKSLIECDEIRLDCFQKFVNSRIERKTYSAHNDYELELVKKHNLWRSSETTCKVSYSYSKDWLAGIYEAEGSFTNHGWTGSPIIQLSNTNISIVKKVVFILRDDWLSPHIQKYEGTDKHQPYWLITLVGSSKYKRFCEKYASHLRYRLYELEKIKI